MSRIGITSTRLLAVSSVPHYTRMTGSLRASAGCMHYFHSIYQYESKINALLGHLRDNPSTQSSTSTNTNTQDKPAPPAAAKSAPISFWSDEEAGLRSLPKSIPVDNKLHHELALDQSVQASAPAPASAQADTAPPAHRQSEARDAALRHVIKDTIKGWSDDFSTVGAKPLPKMAKPQPPVVTESKFAAHHRAESAKARYVLALEEHLKLRECDEAVQRHQPWNNSAFDWTFRFSESERTDYLKTFTRFVTESDVFDLHAEMRDLQKKQRDNLKASDAAMAKMQEQQKANGHPLRHVIHQSSIEERMKEKNFWIAADGFEGGEDTIYLAREAGFKICFPIAKDLVFLD